MFCTNCGYQMPDDANFCQKCGRPQNQSAGTASVRTDAEPQWERMEIELREGGTAKRSIITQLLMGDGTVLYVGASGSPQQVAAHLNKRAREASLGQYTTQESHIKFSVTVPGTRGSVDFIGQIYTDRLELDVSSNITGYKAHLTYHFV